MVQPKAEIDLQFESTRLSTPWGYISSVLLGVTTFGTIALMSGFFLKPDATFNDYLADVVPLFGGFLTILGVSEVKYSATMLCPVCFGKHEKINFRDALRDKRVRANLFINEFSSKEPLSQS